MFLKENFLLAIAGLKSNKIRALLTMLGIIIGIGSVIAIVSIGDAVTASVSNTMSSMGASNINVNVVKRENDAGGRPGQQETVDDANLISMEQIDAFKERYADKIDAISLTCSGDSGKVKDGARYANVSISGVNDGYKTISSVTLTSGRFLNSTDVDQSRKVAVVSDKLVSNIFKNSDPLGKEINVYTDEYVDTYTVIGVYKYENAGAGMTTSEEDLTTSLYVPVTVVLQTADNQNFQRFTVKGNSSADTATFTKTVQTYFEKLYKNNEDYTVRAMNMESMLSSMTSMLSTLSIAVAAIAAIALLVGGIGVMNIMLVSVTERTREIGTRKALGARSRYIKVQFIVESIIICVIGGIIGVIFGISLAAVGVRLLNASLIISFPTILLSVGFSMFIGVFFGYYPANKAAKLDPIEALRYE